MKRIFKQACIILAGCMTLDAHADEGEIYLANLGDDKPQVLIILDTSEHMRDETVFEYPEVYDPHITYPPSATTTGEDFIFQWILGGEDFYYNRSDAAKLIATDAKHIALKTIATKGVDAQFGGPSLTDAEKSVYNTFVETIPERGGDKKISYSSMNCFYALEDFQGDLGAYQDAVAQWRLAYANVLGFPVTVGRFKWQNIANQSLNILRNYVDCQADITNNKGRNPGYQRNDVISEDDMTVPDDGDGDDSYDPDATYSAGIPSGPKDTGLLESRPYWDGYGKLPVASFDDRAYLYSDNLVKWANLAREVQSGDSTKYKYLLDENGDVLDVSTTNPSTDSEDAYFNLSNLQIAKKVVLDLMLNNTNIDTGLEIFNTNTAITKLNWADNNGGRIISSIQSYDSLPKQSTLKSTIKDIYTTPLSRSALCESLYEGYRYLYGENVYFGDDETSSFEFDGDFERSPERDRSAENGSKKYVSPLNWANTCQTEAYIIMVTTGHHDITQHPADFVPCGGILNGLIRVDDYDHDSAANEKISSLEGMTEQDIKDRAIQVNDTDAECDKNLLPVLSGWLAEHDMNDTTPDVKERIVTYTVGIGELDSGRRNLLEKTAEYGDGEFYNALNANELRTKLEMAFADIIARQKGVASAVGTSINSSNATKSNEFVYYSMFQPNQTSRWQGNLRKFKVTGDGTLSAWTQSASDAASTDSAVSAALANSDSSFFNDNLYSGWSSQQGLNDVKNGGVAEAFTNLASTAVRNIYITNATSTGLLLLNKANLKSAFSVVSDADLASKLGVSEDTLDSTIDWLHGKDETGNYRDDVFGDPMHAEPLIVEYADEPSKPRIFIGTNAGFFHAFKDSGRSVEEEWAFIPKENIATAISLYLDVTTAENRIYGIDSSAVDAEYKEGSDTKHIITFGMRRGGSKYFSLNVNLDADSVSTPVLNWIIDADSTGYSQLAQTWSTPVVSKIFRGDDTTNDKPVLIFGAGYDESKDDCGSNSTAIPVKACADTKGRAVYIVDADSGDLIESFDTGISDSIASELAVMDSDGDGYADRIYAPDTGGNIYRIDMPKIFDIDKTKFVMDEDKWALIKLASLSGTATGDDRRFFSAPSIVRARDIDGDSYDGLLLGSGDITSPNSNVTARNHFYNIKDTFLYPQVWERNSGDGGIPVPDVIKLENLNSISYDSATTADTVKVVDEKDVMLSGWYYVLNELDSETEDKKFQAGGEKSLGAAVVVNGTVHFNTYTPFDSDFVIENGQCVLNQSGNSHYYQVNLNTGATKYYQKLPNVIAKDLAVHAASSNGASVLRLLGAGKGDSKTENNVVINKGSVDTEVLLVPRSTYRYFNEASN